MVLVWCNVKTSFMDVILLLMAVPVHHIKRGIKLTASLWLQCGPGRSLMDVLFFPGAVIMQLPLSRHVHVHWI